MKRNPHSRSLKTTLWVAALCAVALGVSSCIEDVESPAASTDVNLTNYGPDSPSVGSMYAEAQGYEDQIVAFRQQGDLEAVDSLLLLRARLFDAVRDIAQDELHVVLDSIPRLDYRLTRASGMYLGRQEPSFVVTLEADETLRDRGLRALEAYAREHGQQSIIVSQLVNAAAGAYGSGEGGYSLEPSVAYRTTAGQNIDTLAGEFLDYGFVGFTAIPVADAYDIELYYVPDFESDGAGGGRSRTQYLADAAELTQAGTQNGWFERSEIRARKLRLIWIE